MRVALISLGAFALAVFALCEIGLAYPVAWWLYLAAGMALLAGLIRFAPLRGQLVRIATLLALIAVMAALYLVDWTSRKPFLRDLRRVRVGMTEGEVRQIMGRYIEGTGWPASPFNTASNAPGTLTVADSGAQYFTRTSPAGEMMIKDSLVFRHSNDGAFNSDWGIVSFSNGRVARVEFSPD